LPYRCPRPRRAKRGRGIFPAPPAISPRHRAERGSLSRVAACQRNHRTSRPRALYSETRRGTLRGAPSRVSHNRP